MPVWLPPAGGFNAFTSPRLGIYFFYFFSTPTLPFVCRWIPVLHNCQIIISGSSSSRSWCAWCVFVGYILREVFFFLVCNRVQTLPILAQLLATFFKFYHLNAVEDWLHPNQGISWNPNLTVIIFLNNFFEFHSFYWDDVVWARLQLLLKKNISYSVEYVIKHTEPREMSAIAGIFRREVFYAHLYYPTEQ